MGTENDQNREKRQVAIKVLSEEYSSYARNVYFDSGRLDTRYPGPQESRETALSFVFRERDIMVPEGTGPISFRIAPGTQDCPDSSRIYIGMLDSLPCYVGEVPPMQEVPSGFVFCDIRELRGRVDDDILGVAGRASQILAFDRNTRFCGRCGARTEPRPVELARECPKCGTIVYPRLSPAVIVLVYRDNEALLARSPRFPPGMYSVIAGFAEPGETLEHAVRREVMEETGIAIGDPVYFGSQPWPFPDSLMVGFVAPYQGGSLRPDYKEIEDVGWFRYDAIPRLPGPLSISRALIEWFIKDREKAAGNPVSRPYTAI
jgi:NAD+ diphosphatase